MQFRKSMYLLLGAIVLGSVVSLAPTASAQQNTLVTVALTAPTDSVKPLQAPLCFPGTATVSYDNTGQTNLVGISLQYTASKQPAWASVVISPATDIIQAAPSPTSPQNVVVTKSFNVCVTATQDAPAFTPDTIEVTATATPQAPQSHGNTGKQAVPITASYFSIIDAQLSEAIKVERPQTAVSFPLKVTNFGNANTKVSFAVQDKAENLNVPVPQAVILQSKQQGGNQVTSEVQLNIQTPYHNGYLNEVGVVTYKLTSAYALDPKLTGDSAIVSVVLTTKGFYVPGVELPIAIGLLGLVAIALRRRSA